MKTVGFIGLGTMGKPMAANLLKKGYPLTVYNRTASKADELVQKGAELAASPAEAARAADVLFTNVSDDQALLDLVYGNNGILDGVHPNLTVIDCSTVSPETSRKIAGELSGHFVDFLDAPVTGSSPAAISGTLVFMVGGSKEAVDEHSDLFDTLGSKLVHMGPNGSGSYAKLAHNLIVGINSAAFAEGMAFAVKAGLDPEKFLGIVTAGAANSRQAELKGEKMIDRDFGVQFSLQLMLKDLLLATRETGRFQMPSPLLGSATNLYQMGLSKGLGTQDLCSVVQCYEDWTGLQVARQTQADAASDGGDRRRTPRVNLNIKLQLSVYQWEQEGSFSGQNMEGVLVDLSESGLQIISDYPLSRDMFVVIHFPKASGIPPITGKIIRVESVEGDRFRYGCMLSGLSPYTRVQLEQYIEQHQV